MDTFDWKEIEKIARRECAVRSYHREVHRNLSQSMSLVEPESCALRELAMNIIVSLH
jgi:hypothetical protein